MLVCLRRSETVLGWIFAWSASVAPCVAKAMQRERRQVCRLDLAAEIVGQEMGMDGLAVDAGEHRILASRGWEVEPVSLPNLPEAMVGERGHCHLV
jgi:hypothetical protein